MAISNTNSPLRQRFIDDMSLRKLAPKTQLPTKFWMMVANACLWASRRESVRVR